MMHVSDKRLENDELLLPSSELPDTLMMCFDIDPHIPEIWRTLERKTRRGRKINKLKPGMLFWKKAKAWGSLPWKLNQALS